jgi:hypothetical protein
LNWGLRPPARLVAQTGANDDRPANKGDDIASGKTFEHLIQPVLNADHKPVEIPKLYIVPHGELFGLLDCLIVAGANKRLKAIEIAVASNCVSPVIPFCRKANVIWVRQFGQARSRLSQTCHQPNREQLATHRHLRAAAMDIPVAP